MMTTTTTTTMMMLDVTLVNSMKCYVDEVLYIYWTLSGATEFTPGLVPPSSGGSSSI